MQGLGRGLMSFGGPASSTCCSMAITSFCLAVLMRACSAAELLATFSSCFRFFSAAISSFGCCCQFALQTISPGCLFALLGWVAGRNIVEIVWMSDEVRVFGLIVKERQVVRHLVNFRALLPQFGPNTNSHSLFRIHVFTKVIFASHWTQYFC